MVALCFIAPGFSAVVRAIDSVFVRARVQLQSRRQFCVFTAPRLSRGSLLVCIITFVEGFHGVQLLATLVGKVPVTHNSQENLSVDLPFALCLCASS